MKNKFIYGMIGFLIGCGPNRDFEDKNIFGSQTVGVTSSTVVSSAATGDQVPMWPQDNVGYDVSKELPTGLSWGGYPEGEPDPSTFTNIPVSQWYDPDGSKGIHAILFLTSKYDCSACSKESVELQEKVESWNLAMKGIKVVVLLINNSSNGKPDASSTFQWKSQFKLKNVTVVVDPGVTFAVSSTFATPLRTIVDPRTMKVFEVDEGYTGDYSTLEGLAAGNN